MRKFVAFIVLLAVFSVFGCAKHDDKVPAMLGLTAPPQPSNVVAAIVDDPLTAGDDYDVTWDIDDPDLVVAFFRIYLVSDFGTELQQDSVTTQIFRGTSIFPVPAFGVTAVTDENVESAMSVAVPK